MSNTNPTIARVTTANYQKITLTYLRGTRISVVTTIYNLVLLSYNRLYHPKSPFDLYCGICFLLLYYVSLQSSSLYYIYMEQKIEFLNLPKKKIEQLKNLGYSYCNEVNPHVTEKIGLHNWFAVQKRPETKTAFELYEEELLNGSISSYNEELDYILKDLITSKTITELTGPSGSGKTQICFQLCISVQLPKWCGGVGGEAVYISTNKNFASHRLRELASKFIEQYKTLKFSSSQIKYDFSENFILKHIHYIKANNSLELLACLKHLESFSVGKQIRLIVIDSISYPLRLLDIKNRHTVIRKLFEDIRLLASTYNFAVVLTNDLTTRVNEGESYITPSLGDSFYHLINNRILLSKNDATFHGKQIKSITQDQKEANFYL